VSITAKLQAHVDEAASLYDEGVTEVEFRGYRFEGVRLPTEGGVREVKNYPIVARRILPFLNGNESIEAAIIGAILEGSLRYPGRDDSASVYNRQDYLRYGGEPLADLMELCLARAA
jgi:hypothetical protein